MRVILDTNILVSALLVQSGVPGTIYRAWIEDGFTLHTCRRQLEELRDTLRKPSLASRIQPHHAGRLVNELKRFAVPVDPLPHVVRSPDRRMIFYSRLRRLVGLTTWSPATRVGCLLCCGNRENTNHFSQDIRRTILPITNPQS